MTDRWLAVSEPLAIDDDPDWQILDVDTWRDARHLADDLRERQAAGSRSIDDIREQVRWISAALQHHRAREADLIFAALGVEIGDR